MEMFLMALCLSLLGIAVSGVLFAAATRDERQAEPQPLDTRMMLDAPRFFTTMPIAPRSQPPLGIPVEVLLMQLERHVRLEQAAAESFHSSPTVQSLHSRTTSPLVH